MATERRRTRRALFFAVLAIASFGLTTAVVTLTIVYWHRRFDIETWSSTETLYFAAGWSSVLLGQLVGLFLWSHVRSIFIKLDLPEDTHGNRRVQAVVRWLERVQ